MTILPWSSFRLLRSFSVEESACPSPSSEEKVSDLSPSPQTLLNEKITARFPNLEPCLKLIDQLFLSHCPLSTFEFICSTLFKVYLDDTRILPVFPGIVIKLLSLAKLYQLTQEEIEKLQFLAYISEDTLKFLGTEEAEFTLQHLAQLTALKESDKLILCRHLIKSTPSSSISSLHKLKIQEEKNRFEIALAAIKAHPFMALIALPLFQITDKKLLQTLFEKFCKAKEVSGHLCYHLSAFPFVSDELKTHLILAAVEEDPTMALLSLATFHLSESDLKRVFAALRKKKEIIPLLCYHIVDFPFLTWREKRELILEAAHRPKESENLLKRFSEFNMHPSSQAEAKDMVRIATKLFPLVPQSLLYLCQFDFGMSYLTPADTQEFYLEWQLMVCTCPKEAVSNWAYLPFFPEQKAQLIDKIISDLLFGKAERFDRDKNLLKEALTTICTIRSAYAAHFFTLLENCRYVESFHQFLKQLRSKSTSLQHLSTGFHLLAIYCYAKVVCNAEQFASLSHHLLQLFERLGPHYFVNEHVVRISHDTLNKITKYKLPASNLIPFVQLLLEAPNNEALFCFLHLSGSMIRLHSSAFFKEKGLTSQTILGLTVATLRERLGEELSSFERSPWILKEGLFIPPQFQEVSTLLLIMGCLANLVTSYEKTHTPLYVQLLQKLKEFFAIIAASDTPETARKAMQEVRYGKTNPHLAAIFEKRSDMQALWRENPCFELKDLKGAAFPEVTDFDSCMIYETDYFEDLLRMPKEQTTPSSQEEVTRSIRLLPPLLFDGKCKAVFLQQSDRQVLAVLHLKLLLDATTKEGVLFIDSVIPHNLSPLFLHALIQFTIRRAKSLGIPLAFPKRLLSDSSLLATPCHLQALNSKEMEEWVETEGIGFSKGPYSVPAFQVRF